MQQAVEPALAPPLRLRQYDPKMGTPAVPANGPTALLVCHGMGQQVPFETLDGIATAICAAHTAGSARVCARLVQLSSDDSTLSRVEIALSFEASAEVRHIHLYEAYWAPLTEGAIGYLRTALFLVRAGWEGFRASLTDRFDRWIFGGVRPLEVKHGTLAMLSILLLLVIPVLAVLGAAGFLGFYAMMKQSFGQVIQHPWWHAAGALALLASWRIRRFVLQYMGDVAIYVSSNEVNEFWRIRDEIKGIGLRAAAQIYRAIAGPGRGSGETGEDQVEFEYGSVVIVGHSLGSVVAYDTLNALFKTDQPALHGLRAVERTYALVTLGSPLDKTAFLFRQHLRHAVVREVLAATVQPMIQSYNYRPRWWINVHARADIISGSLEYYDFPRTTIAPQRVRNVPDPVFTLNPVAAHTGYWRRQPGREMLYRAVCGTLDQHFGP